MNRLHRTPKNEAYSTQAGYSSSEGRRWPGFFSSSIAFNFLAILLIIGAVLTLHAASKKFIFSDEKNAVVQTQPEAKAAPAAAQADDTGAANKTETPQKVLLRH